MDDKKKEKGKHDHAPEYAKDHAKSEAAKKSGNWFLYLFVSAAILLVFWVDIYPKLGAIGWGSKGKPVAVNTPSPATPDFPPIVVNLAGWGEWVRISPRVLPHHARCYFEGPDEAEVEWSSGRVTTLHEMDCGEKSCPHEAQVGRPIAFRGEAGTKATIICKRTF